jgi:Helix-turn-helix domain
MRGRKPCGPAAVERLPGSALAHERLRVVLETLAGTCRVAEACARLGIGEQRFDQLRTRVLQAGLDSLEPRRAGRQPRAVPAADVAALQARVAELEIELRAARVREEIALVLPAVGVSATEPAKKSPRRRSASQRRRPRPT